MSLSVMPIHCQCSSQGQCHKNLASRPISDLDD